jgi:Phage P22-like portal protein
MPQIPEDLDEQADTDEAIFLECAERLRIAEEAESVNRLLAIEDMEFADGQQWPDDLYNMRKVQRRPSLTINHTGTLVRRVVNNMAEQRPRIKAHPVGDGAQVEDARVAQGLVRHVENRSQAEVAYDTAGESAVRAGWGYVRILGEYVDERSFDQELRIKPVRNPLTGYIDPAAEMPDGSDMQWFIFSDKMSRQDFKRRYPDEQLIDWSHGAAGDNQKQWLTKTQIRIAEYYRIKKTKDTLYQLSDKRTVLGSEMRGKWEAFKLAGITVVQQRPTERRQIQWFRINGVAIVDRRDLPGRWIPVARCEGNVLDINGDVRRKGMIRDLKDPQRMFNYWETAKTEKLALSSKAPWVAAEGQLDGHPEWDDANQKPYSVLKYKLIVDPTTGQIVAIPPPQRQAAVEVEAGFAEAAESAGKNLMMVAGMPHEPGQDTPGTVVSGLALRRRQQISDISHVQYYNKQTMMIAHVGRILLDLFPAYYGTERMQRIIGDDGVPEMVALNQPQETAPGVQAIKYDMNVGRYDVVMDTGPGYETKRLEGAENMIDLLKTPLGEPVVKVASDVVMRNFDFNGAQDIADRLAPMTPQGLDKAIKSLPKQAQGIVTAMQQQLQQAQQTIQSLQLEIKYKGGIEQMRQGAETDRKKMELATRVHDTNTKADTAREDTHVKAQASIAVAEIHEAGQMVNTHVEAAHNKELVKETAKAAEAAEKRNGAE